MLFSPYPLFIPVSVPILVCPRFRSRSRPHFLYRSHPRARPRSRPLLSVSRTWLLLRYNVLAETPGLATAAADSLQASHPVCRKDAVYGMTDSVVKRKKTSAGDEPRYFVVFRLTASARCFPAWRTALSRMESTQGLTMGISSSNALSLRRGLLPKTASSTVITSTRKSLGPPCLSSSSLSRSPCAFDGKSNFILVW